MDVVGILSITMLVLSGGFLFVGIPLVFFLLRNRLSFWPRQKWRLLLYEAEIRDFPIIESVPLLDTEGKQIYDTKGQPVSNERQTGTEKRLVILYEKPELDTFCWRFKEKIIEWVWVDRGMLKGFKLDMTFLAYNSIIEGGSKAIRVAHISKGVWEGGSFYPIGQPDITMLDKRHAIFTHKIDKETIDQSISAMAATAWVDFQKNRARKDEDGIMKLLQVAAPVFICVIVLMVAMFAFDFASKSIDKSTALVDEHLKTCETGYNIQNKPAPVANTTTPSGSMKLPFG